MRRRFGGLNLTSADTKPAQLEQVRAIFVGAHRDRIFNFKTPDRTVPDDFGVLLTSCNIDDHLAQIRTAREQYRQTHPQDVAEIEAMAREVAKAKRCNSTGK